MTDKVIPFLDLFKKSVYVYIYVCVYIYTYIYVCMTIQFTLKQLKKIGQKIVLG